MKNALLPSHLHKFGNYTDFQMTNWDAQMNMNRTIGFCMGSKANESDVNRDRTHGDFSASLPLEHSSFFTYQTGYSNEELRYDHGTFQQPLLFDKSSDSATQFEDDFQVTQNGRKRQMIEDNVIFSKNELGGSIGSGATSNEWNKSKRSKLTNSQHQRHNHQFHETIFLEAQNNRKMKVPVRRSQKLSDKITTLQKLVSPYGKTDTASVLQEASVYIMLLQKQIQNLHRIFDTSYKNAVGLDSQECGSSSSCQDVLDLRSKGLCLVPISMTQKVTMEEGFDVSAASTSFVIANHF